MRSRTPYRTRASLQLSCRRLRRLSSMISIAFGFSLSTAALVADDTAPKLGLGASRPEASDFHLYHETHGKDEVAEGRGHTGHYWHPYYNHFGYYPWYASPRTYRYQRYPENSRTARTPDLRLHVYDPYAWEHGLLLPPDHAPLATNGWRGYEGVVGAAKRKVGENAALEGGDGAIALMREAKYKDAGRRLAAAFRRDDNPRYPLLLTEVFVALGKTEHAALLLDVALTDDRVVEFLPQKIASHFPAEEYARLVSEVTSKSGDTLLAAYLLVHSAAPEKGLNLLKALYEGGEEKAGVLYRHYLGRIFREES